MIHQTAIIEERDMIAKTAIIREYAIVRKGTRVGDRTVVNPFAHIEENCHIGSDSFVGTHANLRRETIIGNHSVFGTHSQSEGKNTIGSHVTIHTCCHIAQGTAIEDSVFIAPFFMGANVRRITHGRSIPKLLDAYKIKYGARIGVSVTVLPRITIGREALVGAGSLVTKDVPDYAIVFGAPATIRGSVPEDERIGHWGRRPKKRQCSNLA